MHASLPKITKTFLKRGIVKSLIEPRGELGADLKMTQRRVSSTEMNFAAKVLLVVFVVLISYLISILLLISLFPTRPWSMHEMMENMMNFNQQAVTLNLVAILLAGGVGLLVFLLLRAPPSPPPPVREVDELRIIRKVLSEDEKAIIDEIRRAGKITQDSLRFRLGWSKAKVSRILTNLDKMNLIQRERIGKTYNVFLTEERK